MYNPQTDNLEHQTKDYLWLNLRDLPYFRALLRSVEARFYDEIEFQSPTLDLGCGDGHFAKHTFTRSIEIGIDPSLKPLREAFVLNSHSSVVQSIGARLPFPDFFFASAISNSVLEHIPDIDAILTEMARVLQPGAVFVFSVPNHNFLPMLSIGRALDRLGLNFLGDIYRKFFNRITRHHHCNPPDVWEKRLLENGFILENWWHYFSPGALRTLEWGHYWGLPSWISKLIFGRWILIPTPWNLALTRHFLQPYYDESPKQDSGVYTFYIVRRS